RIRGLVRRAGPDEPAARGRDVRRDPGDRLGHRNRRRRGGSRPRRSEGARRPLRVRARPVPGAPWPGAMVQPRADARRGCQRVNNTPPTITTPPTIWPARIASFRKTAARTTARAGTRNWSAAVRVAPTTLTPFITTRCETPDESIPE